MQCLAVLGLLAQLLPSSSGGPCSPAWAPTFGALPGVENGSVLALALFDAGGGPELYLGGSFERAGGVPRSYIARWNGTHWDSLGDGLDGTVQCLLVFDDGSGPALYVGGSFTHAGGLAANRIARWDGASWTALGQGMEGGIPAVLSLAAFDDGSGPALYAGGSFTMADGGSARGIARWNGTAWSALGAGVTGTTLPRVRALVVHDDGTGGGAALYAGGAFTTAGGAPAASIARWDGAGWSGLGAGMSGGLSTVVNAFAIWDGGTGPRLFAGGQFTSAGGVAANNIAGWDGNAWFAMEGGLTNSIGPQYEHVDSLAVWEGALLAGGSFNRANGIAVGLLALWNESWSAFPSGVFPTNGNGINALLVESGMAGPKLHIGGNFISGGSIRLYGAGTWDGTGWTAIGKGFNGAVLGLASFDDGSGAGPDLIACGSFTLASGTQAGRIARWNGLAWDSLGGDLDGPAYAAEGVDLGNGPELFITGAFVHAGGVPASRIARWDGTSWAGLGEGLSGLGFDLELFDDGLGDGPRLIVCGTFTQAGDASAGSVAAWDGASWKALGAGMNDQVRALEVFDDGGGAKLYATGRFTNADGVPAAGIACWDGFGWTPLGSGLDSDGRSLAVFDDGLGPALYVGGLFRMAGGSTANYIARWNGASWSSPGNGLASIYPSRGVMALATLDDGNGPALFAGGEFLFANGVLTRNLARWDGASWSACGPGVVSDRHEEDVEALVPFDDGTGLSLVVGGNFTVALASEDAFLARWQGCLDRRAPVLSHPDRVWVEDPLSTPLGEIVLFDVTATDTVDPAPVVVCTPPSGSLFFPGWTRVHCTATDASGNVAASTFRVFVDRGVRPR